MTVSFNIQGNKKKKMTFLKLNLSPGGMMSIMFFAAAAVVFPGSRVDIWLQGDTERMAAGYLACICGF